MTAIIGVLNSQAVAIAADSAVTITAGNVKKVYNKGNKLFTLSKYHPVGIAIYNSLQFMGVPWETLIKLYRKQLKDKKFDTVKKYQDDFLSFLSKNLGYITPEAKVNNFYVLYNPDYNLIKKNILKQISDNEAITEAMTEEVAASHISPIISEELQKSKDNIDSFPKNPSMTISFDDYVAEYSVLIETYITALEGEIKTKHPVFTFTAEDKEIVKEIFHGLIKLERIFEQSSGLIFIGFGDKEIYPSSHEVTVGSVIKNIIRYKINEPTYIVPGKHNANILSYAQKDVTMSVLKGIDPTYQNEINSSIGQAFKSLSDKIVPTILDVTESTEMASAIQGISDTLVEELETYRHTTITQPLLDILEYMGKEDMSELAESLVTITSLKRKFTLSSSDESVGGPVDVAVITKGDGFIWIKRKNYFDIELNKGYISKYYNS